jgi:CMP-N-acetylneuraminic acid synthetase
MFPKTYKANGYIDILKTDTILRGSLHGDKILAYVTPRIPEIDTEEDFLFAEHFYKKIIEQEQKKT